jgi:hypothetical protein
MFAFDEEAVTAVWATASDDFSGREANFGGFRETG